MSESPIYPDIRVSGGFLDGADTLAKDVLMHPYMKTPEMMHILKWRDLNAATGDMKVPMQIPDNSTYRIRITPTGVDVICFGMESIDSKLEGNYDSVDALPDWVKERLAVLMVMDSAPPIPELEGVGRRISERVFWVYYPTSTSV